MPTFGELLRQHARMRSDQTAAVCGETRLTYAELNGRVDRLASGLEAAGVEQDSIVLWTDKNCIGCCRRTWRRRG